MFDLSDRSDLTTLDPAVLLRDAIGISDPEIVRLLAQAAAVRDRFTATSPARPLRFPANWAATPTTGALLFAMVRHLAPEIVVETGVANGVSSTYLLAAMEANGRGRLVSFDLDPAAGGLIPTELRHRWTLRVLPASDPTRALATELSTLPPVDLAFLDADHSYPGQAAEYRLIGAKLQGDRWLVSDDVDWSFAFLDYCDGLGSRPKFLVTESKVVGLVRPGIGR